MDDIADALKSVRRPRLLIRAARFGMADYRRERDLSRLVGPGTLPSPRRAIGQLMEEEAQLEDGRRAGAASYSIRRHVEILIALMAEARLLPAQQGRGAPASVAGH